MVFIRSTKVTIFLLRLAISYFRVFLSGFYTGDEHDRYNLVVCEFAYLSSQYQYLSPASMMILFAIILLTFHNIILTHIKNFLLCKLRFLYVVRLLNQR